MEGEGAWASCLKVWVGGKGRDNGGDYLRRGEWGCIL